MPAAKLRNESVGALKHPAMSIHFFEKLTQEGESVARAFCERTTVAFGGCIWLARRYAV